MKPTYDAGHGTEHLGQLIHEATELIGGEFSVFFFSSRIAVI